MQTRRAVKYRLYPTKAQERKLQETLETCRHLYNRLLGWRKESYETTGEAPGYYEQKRALPGWKQESPWLPQVHAHVLQTVPPVVLSAFSTSRPVRRSSKPVIRRC